MSPLTLAALWLMSGVAGAAASGALHRRRAGMFAPVAAGLLGMLATVSISPGPLGSVSFGATLALDRTGAGLLTAAGMACGLTLALAPSVDGVEALTMGVVGAAAVVALAATVPIIWAVALAVGVGAVALRWIAVAPERSTLSTGRVAGMGAALLLAWAALLPAGANASGARTTLSGALLAAGACTLLAIVPVGGWGVAASTAVRGADLAAWGLLLAPAVLLGTGAAMTALPERAGTTVAGTLLVLGLLSAVYGGGMAMRTPGVARYGRVLLADIGLAAAGLGSRQDVGRFGVLVILLSHLATAPLLLHAPRPGLRRPHRLAWLALSGLPLSAAFWGRLLVLEALAATSPVALVAGLAASAVLLFSAARALIGGEDAELGRGAATMVRALAWVLALFGLAVGFAPGWTAARVFGVDLGG